MSKIENRLSELGLSLPEVPAPVASYVNAVESGSLLYISGGLPPLDGEVEYLGSVPSEISAEQAAEAARLTILNRLSVIKEALGDLDRVTRIVKVEGLVNADAGYAGHPSVINGASDLLVEVFGDAGKHSRVAYGVASLPLNVCVEISMVVEFS